MPELSVIVPTLGRPAELSSTVTQILQQSYAQLELIIIDQSDHDIQAVNEAMVASMDDKRIKYVHTIERNLPAARNIGICASSTESRIILFLDDDVVLLNPNFLQAHVDAFEDPSIGAVTGRTIERRLHLNSSGTVMCVTWAGRTRINLMGMDRTWIRGLKGANMSVRRSLLEQVGGFDRNYRGSAILEDVDMAERIRKAGAQILFEPAAELLHLSAPAGGVRVADRRTQEMWRYELTAYFMRKHRRPLEIATFAMTFALIALKTSLKWRDPSILPSLARSAASGFRLVDGGADEALQSEPLRRPVAPSYAA